MAAVKLVQIAPQLRYDGYFLGELAIELLHALAELRMSIKSFREASSLFAKLCFSCDIWFCSGPPHW